MNRILIVEDEEVIRAALKRLLERRGYQAVEAGSVEEARARIEETSFDLVLADLRLPGAAGTDMIAIARDTPVLIMTSYASVKSAVEAMKLGAVDYIAKPFDHDELLLQVQRILQNRLLARQAEALKSDVSRSYPVGGMIGNSAAMRDVFERIRKVGPTDTTVLILGESGTGKELAARAVHELSSRRDAPIIAVNCAAIPEGLIESELFGHEKGAFTGAVSAQRGLVEVADGGTLFLDEIGELPAAAQARLLRVLQEGEIRRVGSPHARKVNIRLVAATHRNLENLVAEGRFRADLYFRLRVMEVSLPPLRERGDDVRELAQFLLDKACRRLNRPPLAFTPGAIQAILAHRWPGNVRELENAIERAVILCDGDNITPALLAIDAEAPEAAAIGEAVSLEGYFRRFVLEHQQQLTETELARRLGISRKTLWERRQRLGLPRPRENGQQ
ncbi:MAG: sigma-54-dependent Fis family transcriptional regulator [Gammaproteobacteria bacterium]|nr:MAG: sigma-54-dependent Fis family transcriptional regulator [Gammaproteobacteria bacterium]